MLTILGRAGESLWSLYEAVDIPSRFATPLGLRAGVPAGLSTPSTVASAPAVSAEPSDFERACRVELVRLVGRMEPPSEVSAVASMRERSRLWKTSDLLSSV